MSIRLLHLPPTRCGFKGCPAPIAALGMMFAVWSMAVPAAAGIYTWNASTGSTTVTDGGGA